MTASWTGDRHVMVLLVAMVVAAYHMIRLEQRRAHRDVHVDEEFDRAVALLRTHFMHHDHGDYHVLIAQRSTGLSSQPTAAANARSLTAFIVNRTPPIPRIEAELFVDVTVVTKPTKSSPKPLAIKPRTVPPTAPRHQKPQVPVVPLLTFLVYDVEAMAAAASLLEQRGFAHIVRHHGSPVE